MTSDAAPRSLADVLRTWSDAQLLDLIRSRPDLLHPVPTDVAALAGRASSVGSCARALDHLDRFHTDLLEAVAVLTDPVGLEDLHGSFAADPAQAVDSALAHLRAVALVFGPDDDLRLVRTVSEQLGPAPAGLGPAARYSHPRLAAVLQSAGGLAGLLAQAPPGALDALSQLVWGPPHGTVANATRSTDDPATVRSPIDWLLAHDLLIPVSADTVALPREVALHLRSGVIHREPRARPGDLSTTEVDPAEATASAAGQAFRAVRLVETLLDDWSLTPPAVLRAGGLGVRDLRRAAQVLDSDERTAALVVEAAHAAGLVARNDDFDEAYVPTPAYDAWLTQEVAIRWATICTAWLGVPRIFGPVGAKDARGKAVAALSDDLERAGAAEVRREALAIVASVAPGLAVSPDDIVARLDWLRPRRGGSRRSDEVRWALEEATVFGVIGRGAVPEHGRALLAADEGGVATALTPLLPDLLDHVLLQADLTAVAPGPLEPGLAAELALLADIESTGAATVYRFTPDSVRRALDAGRSAADLHQLLETRSRTPVPQPLTYLVDDVARRHGQVRVGAVSSYIRCDDEATLAALVADRRCAGLRLHRLAPTVLAAQASPDQVLQGLRDMGYAPAAEAADGTVVVRRPDLYRTPTRHRPPRSTLAPSVPNQALLEAAVRALRAGERATTAPRTRTATASMGGSLPRRTTSHIIEVLRSSVETGEQVWIGYVDSSGAMTERLVDPLRFAGGFLTAFDHRSEGVETFAVHRITGVAVLEDGASTEPGDNGGSDPAPEGDA